MEIIKTEIETKEEKKDSAFHGECRILCSGCSNRCELTVRMREGLVDGIAGEGCRRGIISARKQLEKKHGAETAR